MSARGNRGGFLKGSERPEAGCLGEYNHKGHYFTYVGVQVWLRDAYGGSVGP